MINMPNIDGKIWNIQYKTVDILQEYHSTGKIVIELDSEGPDNDTLGLYELLDYIVDSFDINPSAVEILTHNQIEQHQKYTVKRRPPLYLFNECKNFEQTNVFRHKTFDSNFKTFGMFVGRLNAHRLELLNFIHQNFKQQSVYTCHYDRQVEFHQANHGITKLIQDGKDWKLVIECIDTLSQCPLKFESVDSYPILSPAHMNISKVYHEFFVEIVAETYYTGETFFPTEKTWRPILLRTPFIVQGSQNYLENLRKLGFQTFDKWWDEGYGEDPADHQIVEIQKVINTISKWSTSKMKKVYHDMKPIIDNNFECMQNLSESDFRRVFNYE